MLDLVEIWSELSTTSIATSPSGDLSLRPTTPESRIMQAAWEKQEPPSISITRTRRVSVSSPLRFTRTFSEDSLDSIEKSGRKELRRQRLLDFCDKFQQGCSLYVHPPCPHLGDVGRSRTETTEADLRLLSSPIDRRTKLSAGDLSRPLSPTRRNLNELLGSRSSVVENTETPFESVASKAGLTAYQQKLLLQSWPNIYATGSNAQFASSLYTVLCNKNPKARQLLAKANGVAVFANSDVDCTAMHARATVELLDAVVRGLDSDHSRLTNYIIELGRAHRGLRQEGLSIAVWDDLGDAVMDCARKFEVVRKHKELRRAWLAVIAYIMDNLKQGQSMTRASSSLEISSPDSQGSVFKKNSFSLS
ncbi:unnamed protein product [Caenorhabditis auriculariae]|uniref:Globin domain-containing protein n=1 Tax=Caenorhabditis auriculariae TaxID=2777116 RepID=A0A8S1HMB3_9PELO|nr:unnamed protein product [Caenorhabditis auriculariae]